jgi:hypothetical protein
MLGESIRREQKDVARPEKLDLVDDQRAADRSGKIAAA